MKIHIDFINEEVDPAIATVTDLDTGKQYDVPAVHFRCRDNWAGDVPAWVGFKDGRHYYQGSLNVLVHKTITCTELIDQSYTVHHFKPVGLGKLV